MLKKIVGNKISSTLVDNKSVIIGVVLCIASFGLFLGAIACTIATLFITYQYMDLVPAMMLGFWITWALSLALGIILVIKK